jgi:hypothetical protein
MAQPRIAFFDLFRPTITRRCELPRPSAGSGAAFQAALEETVAAEHPASSAPKVVLKETPARNQWNYTGPAAYNPFYVNTGNPERPGMIEGFEHWFEPVEVIVAEGYGQGQRMPYQWGTTEEGAAEALRLVQQYEPGARLEAKVLGGWPWMSDRPVQHIVLPGGHNLVAGYVLDSYYNHGRGATAGSDFRLASKLRHIST